MKHWDAVCCRVHVPSTASLQPNMPVFPRGHCQGLPGVLPAGPPTGKRPTPRESGSERAGQAVGAVGQRRPRSSPAGPLPGLLGGTRPWAPHCRGLVLSADRRAPRTPPLGHGQVSLSLECGRIPGRGHRLAEAHSTRPCGHLDGALSNRLSPRAWLRATGPGAPWTPEEAAWAFPAPPGSR